MHERTNIQLSVADRNELKSVVANRNSPQKHVWRAKIVLMTADDHGTAEIMQATGKVAAVMRHPWNCSPTCDAFRLTERSDASSSALSSFGLKLEHHI